MVIIAATEIPENSPCVYFTLGYYKIYLQEMHHGSFLEKIRSTAKYKKAAKGC